MSNESEMYGVEFLELSPNILATMPRLRPPVAYYTLDDVRGMQVFCKAEERVPANKVEEIEKLCEEGNLFLNKQDYKTFSKFLSSDLGIILVQEDLDPAHTAHIFYLALERELLAFFARPIDETFENLKNHTAILCEYIWADSTRAFTLPQAMEYQHSLGRHCVNTCFMGIALFSLLSPELLPTSLLQTALGFLVHDIGMNHVPDFIRNKKGPLLNKEKMRVKEHTASGLKNLQRLSEPYEEMQVCIEQHHERINGSGYPRSLKGDAIHPVAKICALADSFCAMRSNRVYAKAKDLETTIAELATSPAYDKKCLNALLKVCDLAGLTSESGAEG